MNRKFILFLLVSYLFSLTTFAQDVCPGTPYQLTTAAPYTQDFESWSTDCSDLDPAGDIPDAHWANSAQGPLASQQGWRISTYSAWTSGFTGFTPYPSGSHSARFKTASTPGTVAAYLDLYLDCSASPGTQQMTFYYLNSNLNTSINFDSLRIMVSTDGTTFTQVGTTFTQTPGWVLETLTFASSSATTIVRFVGSSYSGENGSSDIGLDDLTIGTLTACSGTPVATALSPGGTVNVSLCNTTQTFGLTTNYATVSGIAYQWQQSTDGVTFAPISGATNATYTGSFTNTTPLYINCVVTCTTSATSVTSGTDTVAIATQSYAVVTTSSPYVQGFENQWINGCATDDIPDMYWVNTPATGNDSWRRNDDPTTVNSAAWGAINSAAYTPGGSDANGAISSYSARFHSYDGAAGTTGTLDLYLDLSAAGTKQISYDYINTAGYDSVSVLISTTGPNGPFTRMDGVITSANWATHTFTTTATSSTCVLRFLTLADFGNSDIGLDNVSVSIPSACAGAPATTTLTPSNVSLSACSPSQTFTLTGSYTGITGITYQWQQSTDGINYTAIAGATGTTYAGAFAGTTYLNCLITCTNSNLSTPSSTDTITVTPQSYTVLPYLQDFESWVSHCGTDNEVPDTNWINSSPAPITSTNAGWRQSNYNLWNGGANAFSPYPSGSYSARFHSSGTSGSGISASGNLDLYVDCSSGGTEQMTFDYLNSGGSSNSDSMTIYISTNGAAGPFTEIASYVGTDAGWEQEALTFASNSATTVVRFTGTAVFGFNNGSDLGLDALNISALPPCTGTPATAVASPSNVTLPTCTPAQTFTLSNVYAGTGGLTYQWQQSADGITFTPIAGATNPSYTGTFTASTTYVNCLVTCTTSGLSALTNTDTVNYNAGGASLPWTEGFETIGSDEQLPSCWAATNLGFTQDTWAESQAGSGLNLVPHTGNGFADFSYSATNDFFFTPGFALTSGTTYQFSFWYITDGLGGNTNNGEYNFYIDYGTSQTAGAMTNAIGSVLNFNNTTYTQYVTTFTPAASGFYYIGINAQNSAAGNSDEYWSFDDVALDTVSGCSGAPAVGTALPSSVALSPCNPVQTLALSSYLGVGGLTYQWQQSADGINYTPIAGATNTTYTGTFSIGTTYLNCLVTCTASGLSTPSNTDTVSYPSSTTLLPWTEGFETIGGDEQLPNCWAANDLGNNEDTWAESQAANGYNQEPHTGNGFADFSYFANNDFFYTPAFSLTAGTTYQFSFWYITDGLAGDVSAGTYGFNIDYGVSQTAADMTNTIGSLSNFNNTTYSQYVANFTPATTGIYYIGISAQDISGTTNEYWSFDDVSLSTLTACSGTPAAGTTSPTSASLTTCNPGQIFTLSGYIGIGGLTYQWQQSTDGVNYTPVPGATDATYTGVFGGGTTYVNCLATCTASGLSASSNVDTVTLAAQNYVAVTLASPYIQGFEDNWISKCATDDAPDNYWTNLPATGDNSWRRNDDPPNGNTAYWVGPFAGAYTPGGSDANGATGSYSARFHSYEANAGTTGTLDLYLDLSAVGPKLISYDYINTSGYDSISVLMSTTGPGGVFTRLDGAVLSANWSTYQFTTAATSSTCVLRFVAYSDDGSTDIGLDNVSVSVLEECTGAPAADTIDGPSIISLSACNPSHTYTLGNIYTGIGGLTYQWQQSPDGLNYTPIAGATGPSYTGVFGVNLVYVNCVVTCTNSNIATSSNGVMVVISQQGYASIPYSQDFELWASICGADNEAPDPYWVNSDLAPLTPNSVIGWRRSDYWTVLGATGFSPYPSGNYSARFHTNGTSGAGTTGSGTLDLHLNCSTIPGNKQMSFYYINTSGSDSMSVYLSEDSGSTFTFLANYLIAFSWQLDTLSITTNSPKAVIRFMGTAVYGNNGGSDIGLDNVQVYACGASTPLIASGPLTLCSGDSVTLSADTTTTGNTYQWLMNGNEISGATSNVYTANQSGTYLVAINNTNNCPDTSFSDTVVVNAALLPVVAENNPPLLSTTTYASYQWYLNGQAINGATSQTDTPTVDGVYYVVVSDANGCTGQSAPFTLTDLGIAGIATGLQDISLSPDPNTGSFTVRGTLNNADTKQVFFEVTNAIGQTVYKSDKIVSSGAWEKYVSLGNEVANGIYLLHINIDGQGRAIKFVISR